ncbi:MAG: hypothetical protein JSR33_09665 [Proteobacteria bacterium]|nr:hypothetical protein [Pseudomonadota bacterium]
MKRNKYLSTIRSLAQELMHFQEILAMSHHQSFKALENRESVGVSVQKLLSLIQEAEKFRCLTLIEEDYLNFCFLIIHGSDMADQLLTLQGNFEVSIKHALSWKKAAKQFKNFLRGNCSNKNNISKK